MGWNNSIKWYFYVCCVFELLILIAQWLEKKIIRYVHTVQKSTVLDTRRQCQEIIKQNDLPQCDRGSPLTFSLPCPLNNIKHCHTGYIGRVLSCIEADFI